MQLPPMLKAAIESRLSGDLDDLRAARLRLSERYRAEIRDGRRHLDEGGAIEAYLATRLPATYAAMTAALGHAAARTNGFSPQTLLDVGAGPGTALWAAGTVFGDLRGATATAIEASAPASAVGRSLSRDLSFRSTWVDLDALTALDRAEPADLVTLGYVLDELGEDERKRLIAGLWRLTAGLLVVTEPGTPAGWRRILSARADLLSAGARILAPCPHALACPVAAPDWCHFSVRVERSRSHRLAKEASVPFEDEKFVYLVACRPGASGTADPIEGDAPAGARVLASPVKGKGKVALKLCTRDGRLEQRLVTKRQGEVFREARRLDNGDVFENA